MSEVFGNSVVENCMQNFDKANVKATPCKSMGGYYMNRIKTNFEESMEEMVPPFLVAFARFVNPF